MLHISRSVPAAAAPLLVHLLISSIYPATYCTDLIPLDTHSHTVAMLTWVHLVWFSLPLKNTQVFSLYNKPFSCPYLYIYTCDTFLLSQHDAICLVKNLSILSVARKYTYVCDRTLIVAKRLIRSQFEWWWWLIFGTFQNKNSKNKTNRKWTII